MPALAASRIPVQNLWDRLKISGNSGAPAPELYRKRLAAGVAGLPQFSLAPPEELSFILSRESCRREAAIGRNEQTMAEAFDPYLEWLKIPLSERPVDFYRLLGLPRFESDAERISAACDQRMALVRKRQMGPHGVYTQQVLNDLAAARVCLLQPQSKAEYDHWLGSGATQPTAAFTPPAAPLAPPAAPQATGMPAYTLPPASVIPPHLAALQASQPTQGQWLAPAPFVQAPMPPPVAPPRQEPLIRVEVKPKPAPPSESEEELEGDAPPPNSSRFRAILAGALLAVVLGGGYLAWKAWSNPSVEVQPREQTPAPPANPTVAEQQPPPPPQSILLMQEGNGEVSFSPGTAALTGTQQRLEGAVETLVGWNAAGASSEWRFKLIKPGFFQAEINYQSPQPVELLLVVGDNEPKRVSLRASERAQTETATLAIPRGGELRFSLRPVPSAGIDGLIVKSVRFIPVGGAGN